MKNVIGPTLFSTPSHSLRNQQDETLTPCVQNHIYLLFKLCLYETYSEFKAQFLLDVLLRCMIKVEFWVFFNYYFYVFFVFHSPTRPNLCKPSKKIPTTLLTGLFMKAALARLFS